MAFFRGDAPEGAPEGAERKRSGVGRNPAAKENTRPQPQPQTGARSSKRRKADDAGGLEARTAGSRRLGAGQSGKKRQRCEHPRNRTKAPLPPIVEEDEAADGESDRTRQCELDAREARISVPAADLDKGDQVFAANQRLAADALRHSRATIRSLRQRVACLEEHASQADELEAQVEQLQAKVRGGDAEQARLQRQIRATELEGAAALDAMRQELLATRNRLMEAKGNMRVMVRIRPLLEGEGLVKGHQTFSLPNARTLVLSGMPSKNFDGSKATASRHSFSFDRVFAPEDRQADVFAEVEPMLSSFVSGKNICLFAYGQTGSGKTYTIQGKNATSKVSESSEEGLVPRALRHMFRLVGESTRNHKSLSSSTGGASFSFSVMEVYNEALRDLLAIAGDTTCTEGTTTVGASSAVSSGAPSSICRATAGTSAGVMVAAGAGLPSLVIRHDASGTTTVEGLSLHPVAAADEALALYHRAIQARVEMATKSNRRSSRSHLVVQVDLRQWLERDGIRQESTSRCYIVDLAGSERIKKAGTGASGKLLTQTQNINLSLTKLGNVVSALVEKAVHVPYRESVLTWLLKNALGGDCKTLVICNVSPRREHHGESLGTLRFAQKVGRCEKRLVCAKCGGAKKGGGQR